MRDVLKHTLTVAILLLLTAAGARGDAIRLSNIWVDNVTVDHIAGGQITFTNTIGVETQRPLADVQGLKGKAYPDQGRAEDALVRGQPDGAAEALKLLTEVRPKIAEAWLKQWVDYRLVGLADGQGQPAAAVEAYLRLVQSKADAFFLATVPLQSLSGMEQAQSRTDLLKKIEQQLATAKGAAAEGLKRMAGVIQTLDSTTSATPNAAANVGSSGRTDKPAESNQGGPGAVAPAVSSQAQGAPTGLVLPVRMMADSDPVVGLLRDGRFEEAVAAAGAALEKDASNPGNSGTRWYQRGVAELQLGQSRQDLNVIKDAGLDFMRVVVYFGRGGHPCLGASLLEAGFVHQLLGQPRIAQGLYDRAAKLVSASEEPMIRKRLDMLRQSLNTDQPEQSPSATPPAKPAAAVTK